MSSRLVWVSNRLSKNPEANECSVSILKQPPLLKLRDLLRDLIMRVRPSLYARATSVTLKWPKMKITNMAISMLLLGRSLNGDYH